MYSNHQKTLLLSWVILSNILFITLSFIVDSPTNIAQIWQAFCLSLIFSIYLILPSLLLIQCDQWFKKDLKLIRLSWIIPLSLLTWILQRYLLSGYSIQILSYASTLQQVSDFICPLATLIITYQLWKFDLYQLSTYNKRSIVFYFVLHGLTLSIGYLFVWKLLAHYKLAMACALWMSALYTSYLLLQHIYFKSKTLILPYIIWFAGIILFASVITLTLSTDRQIRLTLAQHSLVRNVVNQIPGQKYWLPHYKRIDQMVDSSQIKQWNQEFEREHIQTQKNKTTHVSHDHSSQQNSKKNVVIIILESVRWDVWNQANITPQFHQWKKHGLYLPQAVAQYPATPLAYAALFVSQTPSVITQSTHWIHQRPLDLLRSHFPQMYLSRPNNRWFDDGAITGFMTDPQYFTQHQSSQQALEGLRHFIQNQSEPFLTWVHLYEPHLPWESHQQFKTTNHPNNPKLQNYYSELQYIDHHLGQFMNWFYQQEQAQNTLVWVMADHGQGIGDSIDGKPFTGHHVHVHSQISWVPCYISGPGIPINQDHKSIPLTQLDLMPSVFDFISQQLPSELYAQGQSIYQTLQNPSTPRILPTEAFSIRGQKLFTMLRKARTDNQYVNQQVNHQIKNYGKYPPKLGIQWGQYKLIYNRLLDRIDYFDIHVDEQEQQALSLSTYTQTQLRNKLLKWEAKQNWIIQKVLQTQIDQLR